MFTVHGNRGRTPAYPQTTLYIGGQNIKSKQFLNFWKKFWKSSYLFISGGGKLLFLSPCLVLSSSEELGVTSTSFNGLILRDHFSDPAELSVWVQAKNKYGSAKSNVAIFNTTNISKYNNSYSRMFCHLFHLALIFNEKKTYYDHFYLKKTELFLFFSQATFANTQWHWCWQGNWNSLDFLLWSAEEICGFLWCPISDRH